MTQQKNSHKHDDHHGHDHGNMSSGKWFWIKSLSIAALYLFFVIINIVKPEGPISYTWHWGIWLPLTTFVVFWEGRTYLKIYKHIFKGVFDMNTLIGLASHTLYIFSIAMVVMHWSDPMYSYDQMWEGAAILIVITNIGHNLEDKVQRSSTEAYTRLNEMKNAHAIVIVKGKEVHMSARDIKVGDIVLVKRGELVPLDGLVQSSGEFDYSNITGESKAVSLKTNQFVASGSYNLSDAIKIKVTKTSKESTISKIVESIENVSMSRPKMQKVADKILKFFVPTVLLVALGTFIVYITIGYTTGYSLPWIDTDKSPVLISISAGVTVMAIACPCALGIATPLVYTVSSLLSNEIGVMINDPKALEELARIDIIAFDKTGTITEDTFEIDSIEGDKKLIGIAKALEKEIKHPIAQTINALAGTIAKVTNIKTLSNKGVEGKHGAKTVSMKSYKSEEALTSVALYIDNKPKLIFNLRNKIKEGVKDTIASLKKKGIKTIMITGDNKIVAKHIGDLIGIDKVYSEVDPEEKSKIIGDLQQEGKVAFVGDGFNDSIAMKKANVSIAFASGSDITNSLSDVSIIKDSFASIDRLFLLSKMNNSSVRLSLAYAFSFNTITIPVAMLLLVQPWVGASIMALSDILVAGNAYVYKQRGRRKLK